MPNPSIVACIVSAIASDPDQEYIYFMGYILSDESCIPFYSTSNGYKNMYLLLILVIFCLYSYFSFIIPQTAQIGI